MASVPNMSQHVQRVPRVPIAQWHLGCIKCSTDPQRCRHFLTHPHLSHLLKPLSRKTPPKKPLGRQKAQHLLGRDRLSLPNPRSATVNFNGLPRHGTIVRYNWPGRTGSRQTVGGRAGRSTCPASCFSSFTSSRSLHYGVMPRVAP